MVVSNVETMLFDMNPPYDVITRLGARLQRGRGLLIAFANDARLAELARGWASRVDYACTGAKSTLGLRALLIRPDGVVAWLAEGTPNLDAARAALARWSGASEAAAVAPTAAMAVR
ncbi:hypothetical protein [Sorangium sp. So ce887]|uniref:aromatic-ring hydroxylase C-terminal domain-containing protein n=1 Tax=Sorangium sp. So ce887 TaxID=3133324 RepID=UPI003F633F15